MVVHGVSGRYSQTSNGCELFLWKIPPLSSWHTSIDRRGRRKNAHVSSHQPTRFWLRGAAGVGKSAIAASIAAELELNCVTVASFFCTRDVRIMSDPIRIIPTLVFQLSQAIPILGRHVVTAIRENLLTSDVGLAVQAKALLIKPLAMMPRSIRRLPLVLLVDGLDECMADDTSFRLLLEGLSSESLPEKRIGHHRLSTDRTARQLSCQSE